MLQHHAEEYLSQLSLQPELESDQGNELANGSGLVYTNDTIINAFA